MNPWIQLITAMLGALGFAMIFNLRARYLAAGAAGGLLCWGVYLLASYAGGALFLASMIAAGVCALYAEIAARLFKTPATLILIPSVIPLIPGGSLYYTMSNICAQNWAQAKEYGASTGLCAMGIAAGVSVVFALFSVSQLIAKRKK